MVEEPVHDRHPLRVRDLEPADEPAMERLYAGAFERPWPRRHWHWKVEGGAAAKVLVDGDDVVGHVWYRTYAAFVDGGRVTTQTYGDLMVDPRRRGRGGSRLLIAAIVDRPGTPDLHLAFPAAHTVRLLEDAKRVKGLGTMIQWVRWFPGATLLPATASTVAAAIGRVRTSGGAVAVDALDVGSAQEELDDLAERSAAFAPCLRVRDADALRWLLAEPDRDWQAISARDRRGQLQGWAVYGLDRRDPDGGRGRIVDLLSADAAATRAVLAEAAAELRRVGCRVVSVDGIDPRPWFGSVCRGAGFLPRGVGAHVAVFGRREVSRSPHRLANWYLTAADSDLI